MATKNKLEIPSPPTFSQMIQDLDIMSRDDKLFQLSQLAEQMTQNGIA